MFLITASELDPILLDYGITKKCSAIEELQRDHYEEHDPASRELRLIVKALLADGREVVVRFKNEADVTLELVEAQSRFALLLAENGIETPRVYASDGCFARRYQFGEYDVIVTVEDFVQGELREVDPETAKQTGRLLARMHNIAEAKDAHVRNEVLFDPLADKDLFSFERFARQREYLARVDEALYERIAARHARLLEKVRSLENEPRYAVQGDISDCNLYRTAEGTLGVFDFNRCGDNGLYYDAVMQAVFEARLMDYPEGIAGDPEAVILPAFLRGYHEARPFTEKQIEVFPYLYALISAFWLGDIQWDQGSLCDAVRNADAEAALRWMRKIDCRAASLLPMPI